MTRTYIIRTYRRNSKTNTQYYNNKAKPKRKKRWLKVMRLRNKSKRERWKLIIIERNYCGGGTYRKRTVITIAVKKHGPIRLKINYCLLWSLIIKRSQIILTLAMPLVTINCYSCHSLSASFYFAQPNLSTSHH